MYREFPLPLYSSIFPSKQSMKKLSTYTHVQIMKTHIDITACFGRIYILLYRLLGRREYIAINYGTNMGCSGRWFYVASTADVADF